MEDGAGGWREQADGEKRMEDGAGVWRMKDGGWRKCTDSKAEVDATEVEWWRMQVVASAESREALIPMEEVLSHEFVSFNFIF